MEPTGESLRIALVVVNPAWRKTFVAPLGCERLAGTLLAAFPGRVRCYLSVPFIERCWKKVVAYDIEHAKPHLVCVSFRNLDECVYLHKGWQTEDQVGVGGVSFFQSLAETIREVRGVSQAPIIVGGTGFACAPLAILRRLNIRFGVIGPGEAALTELVRRMLFGQEVSEALECIAGQYGIVDVSRPETTCRSDVFTQFGPVITPRHSRVLKLLREADERISVLASYGCTRRCAFCIEPSLGCRVIERPVEDIVEEIRVLSAQGFQKIWLACSELNASGSKFPTTLFKALARARLTHMDIRSYFCIGHVDEELLTAMEDAGQRPWEQSFEFGHLADEALSMGFGPAKKKDLDGLVGLFLKRGYPTLGGTILLGGPFETYETLAEVAKTARTLDSCFQKGMGLSIGVGIRVYPVTWFGRAVFENRSLHSNFLYPRSLKDGIRPVFYCRPGSPITIAHFFQEELGEMRGAVEFVTSLFR